MGAVHASLSAETCRSGARNDGAGNEAGRNDGARNETGTRPPTGSRPARSRDTDQRRLATIAGSSVAALAAAAALLVTACAEADTDDPVERGRRVYRSNCLVCHAFDPTTDGTIGPAIAGASRQLLEARVLRGEYPAGYTPKRDTRLMPPLPQLADDIDALERYLGSGRP